MEKTRRFSTASLTAYTAQVLETLKVPSVQAEVAAHCLIKAHLRGFDTHGLPCLPGYVEGLQEGRINPVPLLKEKKTSAWTATVDADNGLGQVAAHRAMELALASAEALGIGAAAVRHSNHFGAAGVYAAMALKQDCIGLVTSNTSAVTAPYGAVQPFLGTNPLSVAVPTNNAAPFVIDMATSAGARKKVRLALEEGRPLPLGWALDNAGRPTTDPRAALEGVMLPFGGNKGSAIAMLLDILSGVLTGAQFGGQVLSVFTNQERASDNGHFMLAFKVESFMPAERFKTRMDENLKRVRALRPVEDSDAVRYPGFRAHHTELKRLRKGIPLKLKLIAQLEKMSKKLGLRFPI